MGRAKTLSTAQRGNFRRKRAFQRRTSENSVKSFRFPAIRTKKSRSFWRPTSRKPNRTWIMTRVLDVEIIPFQKALDMISEGSIVDAKTIVGLMLARSVLKPEL